LDRKAAMRVHGALGTARRAAGVDEHARLIRVADLICTPLFVGAIHELVPPVVAPGRPRRLLSGAAMDDDIADRWALRQRLVRGRLHGDVLAAPEDAVGTEKRLGL